MSKEENNLAGWDEVIKESVKQTRDEEELWREQIGEPICKYVDTENIYVFGLWKTAEGDVFTARIGKKGPIAYTVTVYKKEFIKILSSVLES